MSEDADMIVKLWKEKRLSELYCQTVTEHGDEEDVDNINNTDKDHSRSNLNVGCVKNEDLKQTSSTDELKNRNKRKKFQALFCSVM